MKFFLFYEDGNRKAIMEKMAIKLTKNENIAKTIFRINRISVIDESGKSAILIASRVKKGVNNAISE